MTFISKSKTKVPIKESFQDWLGIRNINNNKIFLEDGRILVVLRVMPVNFKLKSTLEQQSILYAYKNFLKNLNSKIQIVISSKRTNIKDHIEEILKFTKENPKLQEMSEDYIGLIKQIINEQGSVTKEFYIVIEETPNSINDELKIIEYLGTCGNEAYRVDENEIEALIKNFTNKRVESLL